MIFLFTKSSKIGSKLIRWGTNSASSHFSIGFDCDESGRGIIFHSHFRGAYIDWYPHFIKRNEVVYKLKTKYKLPLADEEMIYKAILSAYYGKDYDNSAFMYFGACVLWSKISKQPLPEKNELDNDDKFLCVEIYEKLHEIRPDIFPKPEKSLAIMPPDEVFFLMKQSPLLIEVDDREDITASRS